MNTTVTGAELSFSAKVPDAWASMPRARGSLQTLDAALVLAGLGHYPQALLCCEQAIRLATPDGADVQELPDMQGQDVVASDEAVVRLLRTALPALDAAYQRLSGYDFRAGLLPDVKKHLAIAELLIASKKDGERARVCCHSVEFAIRWVIRENFLPPWLLQAEQAKECGDLVYDPPLRADRGFPLRCPMCQMTADCEIEADDTAPPVVWVDRMHCQNCGFWIGRQHRRLSDILFDDELKLNGDRILEEYGLRPKAVESF